MVLSTDSLQLTSTDVASNNIDSPQLTSADTSSIIEQLGTYVKALQYENSNFIQMLLKHVEKYVEEHTHLVVTDPNFMLDALKPETIKGLEETARVMMSAGLEKDLSDVYINCRRECLKECLMHTFFGLHNLRIEDVHNMPWKNLEVEIEKWIKAFNVTLKILLPGERLLCDRIFLGSSTLGDLSFLEISRGSTVQLLSFANSIATGSRSPERLFKILEVFETLRDLIPDFESIFCNEYSVSLRNEAVTIWKRLGETIRDIFMELEDLVDNSSTYGKMDRIMDTLESKKNEKSKFYDGFSSVYIFLMNNDTYIVPITKQKELGTLLANDWIRPHAPKIWHYGAKYSTGTSSFFFAQNLFMSKRYDGQKIEAASPCNQKKGII